MVGAVARGTSTCIIGARVPRVPRVSCAPLKRLGGTFAHCTHLGCTSPSGSCTATSLSAWRLAVTERTGAGSRSACVLVYREAVDHHHAQHGMHPTITETSQI